MKHICLFCGSHTGQDPRYLEAAAQLGHLIASRGLGLVYGGAAVGLMGAAANAALAGGGRVVGVIPEALARREVMHVGLSELHVVATMHARKALMAKLADAFVVLPGGLGTLEELFEVLTWAMLGLHHKPIGLLNVAGYFAPLVQLVDHGIQEGFIRPEHRLLLRLARSPMELLDLLAANQSMLGSHV